MRILNEKTPDFAIASWRHFVVRTGFAICVVIALSIISLAGMGAL